MMGSEATPNDVAVGIVVAESGVCPADKAEKINALKGTANTLHNPFAFM